MVLSDRQLLMRRHVAMIMFASVAVCASASFSYADLSLTATVESAVKLPHIIEDQAFPDSILSMSHAEGWSASGAVDGNSMSVKEVADPRNPNRNVLDFSFKANTKKPKWLNWSRTFPTPLVRPAAGELVFDLYPVTPMNFQIMMEMGLPHPVLHDMGPAFRGNFGGYEPGKWHEVRITSGSTRHRNPAGMRIVLRTSSEGVPNNQNVHFLIRNVRIEPAPDPLTMTPIDALKVTSPIRCAVMKLETPNQLADDEPFSLRVEVSSDADIPVTCRLKVSSDQKSNAVISSVQAQLKKGNNILQLSAERFAENIPAGEHEIGISLEDAQGRVIAGSSHAMNVAVFDSKDFEKRLADLKTELAGVNEELADAAGRGVVVQYPQVTLAVADLFINQYLRQDFYTQKERKIAVALARQVKDLLNDAREEIRALRAGRISQQAVRDYDPGLPLQVNGATIRQNNRPLLLVGVLDWRNAESSLSYAAKCGFNSIVVEVSTDAWAHPENLEQLLHRAAQQGLSVQLLLSTHKLHESLADKYPGMINGSVGHTMLPYDILKPDTRMALRDYYDKMLPYLKGHPNLTSVGTANEPGYTIRETAPDFEVSFRQWMARRYDNRTEKMNLRWGVNLAGFDQLQLAEILGKLKNNPAVKYDWEEFRAQVVGDHFEFMRQEVQKYLPGMMTWVKRFHDFGYRQLDPVMLYDRGETNTVGWSVADPMKLDFSRAFAPNVPLVSTEWKVIKGYDENNLTYPADIVSQRMLDCYVHGMDMGQIWNWGRRAWQAPGDPQSITRYPLALNVIGRTSLKIRQNADVITRFASERKLKASLLYDKISHLQQKDYWDGKEIGFVAAYDLLSANSAGVNMMLPERYKAGDLNDVQMLAATNGCYHPAALVADIEQWVAGGGTLWLTARGEWLDPWGGKIPAVPQSFLTLLNQDGAHSYGKGRIVVDPAWKGYQDYFEGVEVRGQDGAGIPAGEIARGSARDDDGTTRWLYLMNLTNQERTVILSSVPARASGVAKDLWGQADVALNHPLALKPRSIVLLDMMPKK